MATKKRKPRKHTYDKNNNPIAGMLAFDDLKSKILTSKISLYTLEDGYQCKCQLVEMVHVIACVCNAGVIDCPTEAWVRQLHGTLRSIQDIVLNGCIWDIKYAPPFENSLEIARVKFNTLSKEGLIKGLDVGLTLQSYLVNDKWVKDTVLPWTEINTAACEPVA